MTHTSLATPVSIVIPTHNRLPILAQVLDALASQDFATESMEVIVVADGCTDGTEDAIRTREYPFRLAIVTQDGSGAAAARNAGAARASGTLLIFLDDDVIPTSTLVGEHVSLHRWTSRAAAVGPYLLPPQDRPTFFGEKLRRWWEDQFEAMGHPEHQFTYRDLLSGNLSIPAAVFAETGGFNTSFPDAGGEDFEFGVRLLEANIRIAYASRARAEHQETMDLARSFRRARVQGAAEVKNARLHPHVRDTLAFHTPSPTRWLIGRAPKVARLLAAAAGGLLVPLEGLGMRRAWHRLSTAVQHYWYWVGVAKELGGHAKLKHVQQSLDDDLPPGAPAAEGGDSASRSVNTGNG